jgi:hypothetical protein
MITIRVFSAQNAINVTQAKSGKNQAMTTVRGNSLWWTNISR